MADGKLQNVALVISYVELGMRTVKALGIKNAHCNTMQSVATVTTTTVNSVGEQP